MSEAPLPHPEHSTPGAPPADRTRLPRDPFAWVFAVAFVAALLVVTASTLRIRGDLLPAVTDLPFLVLVAGALAMRMRRARTPRSRRFWMLWALALGSWVAAGVLSLATPSVYKDGVPFNLATDLLYVAFYLLIALSVEIAPHQSEAPGVERSVRRARSAGAVVFVFGLLAYFALIPSTLGTWSYETWIPSLLLYVALDVYVFLRLLRVRHVCRNRSWSTIYGWMAAAAAVWVVTDGWDLLAPLGLAPDPPAALWDFVSVPAQVLLLVASRWPAPDPAPSTSASTPAPPERWAGVLMVYAVAFPGLHFLLHATDILDPELRGPRQVWVLAVLSLLALLSWLYQQRIQSAVVRLEARQRALDQRLELTQRMEAVGRLAGGIAHDFNNTLQVIGTHADVLRRALVGDESQRAHADVIRRAVTRAGDLTDQLLTLSRKRRVEPEVFDLNDIPRNLSTLARKVAGERIAVAVEAANEPIWVHADRAQLEHAVLNLLLNARDATPDGGRIELRTEACTRPGEGDRGVLSVQDSGIGMSERIRARIFEPFFTTKAGKGTGLGLSMVYGIVTQCGGEVRVETGPDDGSRFELSFPTSAPPGRQEARTPAHEEERVPPAGSILVVEDELPILSVIALHLRSAGYDVRTATSAESALEQTAERPPDLVLVDVVMPGMNGPTLAERILEAHPGTRAIFMSGYADSVLQGLSGPVTDVPLLRKPFTTDQLDELVSQVMDRQERGLRPAGS